MPMRVGMYNRWLATLGGGEKYSLAVAQHLARHHSVAVISHLPVSKDIAEERLNLDLSSVRFVTIPDCPTNQLASVTTDYDFFINASFLDVFSCLAPRSALIVYFPTPVALQRTKPVLRLGGLFLKRLLLVPSFFGVLDTQAVGNSQLRLIGPRLKVHLPSLREGNLVHFEIASRDPMVRQAVISFNGHPLETLDLPDNQEFLRFETRLPVPADHASSELAIQAISGSSDSALSPIKMAVRQFEIGHPRYRAYQLIFERWLRNWGVRLHRTPYKSTSLLETVDSYGAIWAISEFTRKWIRNYWNRPSELLYPPVDVEQLGPSKKRERILAVGRFFAGSHNKKHDVMIKAFRQMVGQGLSGWELHLAGGTGRRPDDEAYLRQLADLSKGYPVIFHPDIPYTELNRLYAESAIYWHAAGFGEDEADDPIKFEHFGITTVEAMASGCVPVVIGKGGQPEIVKHDRNGFLWITMAELEMLTWRLIQDVPLRQRLAQGAVQDSHRYGKAQFSSRLEELVRKVGIS